MQGPDGNHYDTLGIARQADAVVVKAAYKALMMKYHPDKFPAGSVEAERAATKINEAFAVLRDPVERAAYDAGLRAQPGTARRSKESPDQPQQSEQYARAASGRDESAWRTLSPKGRWGVFVESWHRIGKRIVLFYVVILAIIGIVAISRDYQAGTATERNSLAP